jgi:hypothetical protein
MLQCDGLFVRADLVSGDLGVSGGTGAGGAAHLRDLPATS